MATTVLPQTQSEQRVILRRAEDREIPLRLLN
jgi:hypothetical protein